MSTPRRIRAARRTKQGSVLVPVVAAMLILLMSGFALTELSGAQRMEAVLSIEAARAFWVADAGVQHASVEGGEISSPVAFGGGSYTVTRSGNLYTATGISGGALQVASEELSSTAYGVSDPLDVPASVATAARKSDDELILDLVSVHYLDIEVASFDLSASAPTERAKEIKLDGSGIWKEGAGLALPATGTLVNEGNSSDRTIPAGEAPELKIKWLDDPALGTLTYTLVLYFTNGTQSTLVFDITWT